MNRRDFLTGIVKVSLVGLIPATILAPLPAQAAFKLFRGTAEGQIFESIDSGQSWQLTVNFSPECPILDVFQAKGDVYAEIGSLDYSFFIKSQDGRLWRTATNPSINSVIYLPFLFDS